MKRSRETTQHQNTTVNTEVAMMKQRNKVMLGENVTLRLSNNNHQDWVSQQTTNKG
ncbi:hypothetical protein AXF42_Ash019943 [Apostasia shenzhenica]|uniref:Uncharacterized protein n=1 Tax=Apostasia shenzhenica TaxID=1088818 RepID=A0A2I0AZK2_9ASPA|nr:hypothetical protein AXF42_Ash019943 [Apostasia shenzhenica]